MMKGVNMFQKTDLENIYTYHAPKPGQPEKYTALREKAKELAYLIDEMVPLGREKSVAMTNLEQAIMWANAGIARTPEDIDKEIASIVIKTLKEELSRGRMPDVTRLAVID